MIPTVCIISHNSEFTTDEELLSLVSYLGVWISKEHVMVKILYNSDSEKIKQTKETLKQKSIAHTTLDMAEQLLSSGTRILALESNEIPSLLFLRDLDDDPILSQHSKHLNIAVYVLHMKYEDRVITLPPDSLHQSPREIRYKKFLDQPNIYPEMTEQIEIRLDDVYDARVPRIPLSSKWVNWPTNIKPIVFAPNLPSNHDGTVGVQSNMFHILYKFERVKNDINKEQRQSG